MTFGDRLVKSRERAGLNQRRLAELLEISPTRLNYWEKNKRQPDVQMIKRIASLLKVSADYLIGNTAHTNSNSKTFTESEVSHIKKYRTLDERGKRNVDLLLDSEYKNCRSVALQSDEEDFDNVIRFHIPGYYQPVSAGVGDWNDDDSWEDLLLIKRPPKGAAYVVRVNGDSMEPTFCNGDRLFIRPQDTLENGQIGIFVMDSHMYVKELRQGHLISHNQEYDPIPLNENARCQGRVLGICDDSYFEK